METKSIIKAPLTAEVFFSGFNRLIILLACMMMFFPAVNPGRISLKISKYVSLLTTGISYSNLTDSLNRAFSQGWVQKSTFIILMIGSLIIIVGTVLCGIGGCMSLGNGRMKNRGSWFSISGSLIMIAGLPVIYLAYTQILHASHIDKIQPHFSKGFFFYAIVAMLILISSLIVRFVFKPAVIEAEMRMEEKFQLFLMLLPIIILATVFCYLPLFGWRYAFFDYSVGGTLSLKTFTGFKWFTYLFKNTATFHDILRVLRNTLVMSGLGIATSWLPMAFAIFLMEIKSNRFRRLVQIFTTIPNFISWVLIYAIALAIFSSDGFLNGFISLISDKASQTNWLMSSDFTWLKMLLWGLWKGVGWSAIIYIASISGIDQQLYEAAIIDGAGRFQKIWFITVPCLAPTFFVLLLMSIAGMLSNGLEQYMVFSNALNKDTIQVLDLYVYNIGINDGRIPLSTVVGMSKSLVSIALLFIANRVSKAVRGESII